MYEGFPLLFAIMYKHSLPTVSPLISQLPGEVEKVNVRAINTVLVNLFPMGFG